LATTAGFLIGLYHLPRYALSLEGQAKNIFTNVIAPNAATRMTETIMTPDQLKELSTDFVAPLAAYLVSPQNKVTGAVYECGAGWFRVAVAALDQTLTHFSIQDGSPATASNAPPEPSSRSTRPPTSP
jgi:hypothetical protein